MIIIININIFHHKINKKYLYVLANILLFFYKKYIDLIIFLINFFNQLIIYMNELFLILAALLVVVLLMNRGCEETEHFQRIKNVNCQVSNWTGWSECSGPCKDDIQERTRSVITPNSGTGTACPPLTEKRNCNRNNRCRQDLATAKAPPPVYQPPPPPPSTSKDDIQTWIAMVNSDNSSLSYIKQQINDARSSCKSNPYGTACTQLKQQANGLLGSINEYKRRLCDEGMKNNPAELRRYCRFEKEGPEGYL